MAISAAVLLWLTVAADEGAAVQYTVTDLGMLPGYTYGSDATGISPTGQVVGVSLNGPMLPNGHAFLYGSGHLTDLGALGSSSFGRDVNTSGQVVGDSYASSGFDHAFLYGGGQMTDLGTLGGNASCAYAINSTGQIVGSAESRTGGFAFLYSSGSMTSLGTLSGSFYSTALDINDGGQIVGNAYFASGTTSIPHAFLYTANGGMTDLGTLGGSTSTAVAINASGQVLGTSMTKSGFTHVFLYSSSTGMSDLGSLFTPAGMNDLGQIVGSEYLGSYHAMLYDNGVVSDLSTLVVPGSGLTLQQARAINDAGQIAAYATDTSGIHHAVLLTPLPEPSTVVLLGIAAASLLAYAWRRRTKAS
jgi:probable HAF family extracellular repeat protein